MRGFCYTRLMPDCIFCKIIKGEIPSRRGYEDSGYIAFLDIRPLTKGHTLVIPKQHHRWVWDDPNIGKYMEAAQNVARAQQKVFNTKQIASAILGQEVPHAHIWLVPRHDDDGHGSFIDFHNVQTFSDAEMDEVAEKIRLAL